MKTKAFFLAIGLLISTFSIAEAKGRNNRNRHNDHYGARHHHQESAYDRMHHGRHGYPRHVGNRNHYRHRPPVVYSAPNYCIPPRVGMVRPGININVRL